MHNYQYLNEKAVDTIYSSSYAHALAEHGWGLDTKITKTHFNLFSSMVGKNYFMTQ